MKFERHKTKYPGVYYIIGKHKQTGKPEKIYYVSYYLDGKRRTESIGRQFRDDMTPARASMRRVALINREIEPSREHIQKESTWTLDRIFDEYVEHKKHVSLDNDKYRYKNHIQQPFGNKEPYEIKSIEMSRFKLKLEKKLSPQTVKHVLAQIRRVVNFGVEHSLCENLTFKIKMPRVDNVKTEYLTPEQRKKLIELLREETYTDFANFMMLSYYTGMRKGEILKLQWRDIDFEKSFIYLRDPKGKVSKHIPMNENARAVLLSQKKEAKRSLYAFPDKKGKIRGRDAFGKPARRIKKALDLPDDFRPQYSLRHTFATVLASSGEVDLYTLSKLMTHSDARMTQRYAHIVDESLKRASAVADAQFDTDRESEDD